MNNVEIIALAIILLIVGGAVAYIVKSKLSGRRCIGCPHGGKCSECNANKTVEKDK